MPSFLPRLLPSFLLHQPWDMALLHRDGHGSPGHTDTILASRKERKDMPLLYKSCTCFHWPECSHVTSGCRRGLVDLCAQLQTLISFHGIPVFQDLASAYFYHLILLGYFINTTNSTNNSLTYCTDLKTIEGLMCLVLGL